MSEVSMDLPAQASSVRTARQFVRETLLEWRCPEIVESATLLTSELVTNAVQHSGTDGHPAEPIELRLYTTAHGIRIEVDDDSAALPLQQDASDHGGRGLAIVDTLSTAWGTHSNRTGKTVWFELEQS
jgi:anti-sigma regulatory factor (Ser/Thr protein kinase)